MVVQRDLPLRDDARVARHLIPRAAADALARGLDAVDDFVRLLAPVGE